MKKYQVLICTATILSWGMFSYDAFGQSCNTPLRLLAQSSCDQTWGNYKEGYQDCVMTAANWFWKEYTCTQDSIDKLNKSCEGCAKTFKKVGESSKAMKSNENPIGESAEEKGSLSKGCPAGYPLKCGTTGQCCESGYAWLCISQEKCYSSEETVGQKCDGTIQQCE